MDNMSDKYLKMLDKLKQLKEQQKEDMQGNPEEIFKKMGIDISKIDSEGLIRGVSELKDSGEKLGNIFPNEQFGDFKNLDEQLNKKGNLTSADKGKLLNLLAPIVTQQLKEQGKECFFINQNDCEGEIIDAHSIQKNNNKLSLISGGENPKQVYHFANNYKNGRKEIKPIPISQASTFKGFCKKHDDEIFKPIETHAFNESTEHCFLHSFRSFAYSYHHLKEFQEYFVSFINSMDNSLTELFNTLSGLTTATGMSPSVPIPTTEKIKFPNEKLTEIENQRFENHRISLNNYYCKAYYEQLDYIVHKLNHICPIVSASWLVLHIEIDGGFLFIHNNDVYRGHTCILTVFPEADGSSYIILSSFKSDAGSELLFNQLRKLDKASFEIEITKRIFEQVGNFYISPSFWDSISEAEKNQLLTDINSAKQNFPEASVFIPSINIFNKKYAIQPHSSIP
jgi:hypothetical protein